MVWAIKYGLRKNFRICLIGQHYQKLINCNLIDKDRLKEIEIYKNLQVKEIYTQTLLYQKRIKLMQDNLERAQRLFEQVNINEIFKVIKKDFESWR